MASTGNGNTGTTGQSAASAQAAAAAGNAAASNAANGATNSAGLMGSLIGFGNAVAKGEVGNNSSGGKSDDGKSEEVSAQALRTDKRAHAIQNIFMSAEEARGRIPSYIVEAGDKAYTDAKSEGKTEAVAQALSRNTVHTLMLADCPSYTSQPVFQTALDFGPEVAAFEGRNTGPTYDPSVAAKANTNPNIAAGSSKMGPSAPTNIGRETGGIAGSTGTETVSSSVNDATNTGVTNRGSTVANGGTSVTDSGSTVANGGTSVTDSGTGGSISSSVTPPSRDASSIGLGVYNTDRANYDQDNWNRGMEVESSSLVSDEECKAFAKRAFMENSEPFKRVRISILKKC